MNLAFAYDSETTGLPDFKAPSESPHQPHLVQLAGLLVDLDTRKTVASLDLIIRPVDWIISPEVSEIHGITQEMAMDVGVAEDLAVEAFMDLWAGRMLIGHNESFDRRIIRIAQHRYPDHFSEAQRDNWKGAKSHCTQLLSTPILKLPPTEKMKKAGFLKHKSANLGEAYAHFMGKPLEDAHSALADARAALDVFFAIQDMNGGVKPAAVPKAAPAPAPVSAPAAAAAAAAAMPAGAYF